MELCETKTIPCLKVASVNCESALPQRRIDDSCHGKNGPIQILDEILLPDLVPLCNIWSCCLGSGDFKGGAWGGLGGPVPPLFPVSVV